MKPTRKIEVLSTSQRGGKYEGGEPSKKEKRKTGGHGWCFVVVENRPNNRDQGVPRQKKKGNAQRKSYAAKKSQEPEH